MSTPTPPHPHESWDELAAAYALHALDEPEREAFLAHLAGCAQCQERVGGFELVTAQLGWLAEDDEQPAPPAWSQIRPPSMSAPRTVPAPRRRAPLLALAAAIVVVFAAALTATSLLGSGGGATYATALAACQREPSCHAVRLDSNGHPVAAVLVRQATVRMVNEGMPPAPAGRMYVLWQLPRNGSPVPVVGFASFARGSPAGSLARPYGDTAAFAVSVERAGPLPASPGRVLAVGPAA